MTYRDLEDLAQGVLDEMEKTASRPSAIERLAIMRAQEILEEHELRKTAARKTKVAARQLNWDELNELATEVLERQELEKRAHWAKRVR